MALLARGLRPAKEYKSVLWWMVETDVVDGGLKKGCGEIGMRHMWTDAIVLIPDTN